MSIQKITVGPEVGNSFSAQIKTDSHITLYGGEKLYGIDVDGQKLARCEGDHSSIQLSPGDWINALHITYSEIINLASFSTASKNTAERGQQYDDDQKLDRANIKVVGLGGCYDDNVRSLSVSYIENYQPSRPVATNVNIVYRYIPDSQSVSQTISETTARAVAYESIIESIVKSDYSASAGFDLFEAASFGASLNVERTQLERSRVTEELSEITKNVDTSTIKPAPGKAAIFVGNCSIMQNDGGGKTEYWIKENGIPTWDTIDPKNDKNKLAGYLDLTRTLAGILGLSPGDMYGFATLK